MRHAVPLVLVWSAALFAADIRAGRAAADPSVRAIVLEAGPDRTAIVVSDSSEWDAAATAATRRAIEAASAVPAANVILAATRPGASAKPSVAKAVEAVRAAAAGLVPAILSAGTGREESVSFYRRFLMKDGSVRPDPAPGSTEIVQPMGEADPELVWLQVDAAYGGPLAGLGAFPLSSELAPYPAVAARTLGKLLGPSAPALFAIAPSANLSPADPRSKDVPSAQKIGTVLAAESLKAWARARPLTPGRIRILRETVHLAGDVEAEVQTVALGERFALVALPGDVFSELGVAIRRASPFAHTMVIGLANASIGIVPTAKAFKEGGADIQRARIRPGGGEQLAETALRLLGTARREAAAR